MANNITQLKIGSITYDINDNTKLPKTTYEWNKEFEAGSNGALSLGRYNVYDTQLTFDITSTTAQSLSGKLVIATQNGSIRQAKVFGDATGTLTSKLIIYQSAISSDNRSWVEVFCNFDGWSKNKVHIYAVALNSATVEKQMSSVTISSGTPAAANVTSGDTKWSGTIINDSDSSDSNISIATPTSSVYLVGSTSATAGEKFSVAYTRSSLKLNSSDWYLESTGFRATSDSRLKENIKEFTPQRSILDLPVVEFDFKETKKHTIGCLAQDLQEICPEIVSEDEKGFLSIEESKIIYLLLDEVKKLRAEVDQLKAINNGGNE